MSDDPKSLMRPQARREERDGRTVLVYENGMERDAATGHLIRPANSDLITTENALDYSRRRALKQRREYLEGLIRGRGEEAPEGASLDELEELAGESKKALWSHWYKTFLSSKNLRGMGESANKLLAGPGQPGDEKNDAPEIPPRVFVFLAELTRRAQTGEIIDVESSE
jgi:hypothetical protein